MLDLKALKSALEQLEEERGIPREKILSAIEDALVAAYKKDYGKKGQIVRAHFNPTTGDVAFEQVKIVVDESMLKPEDETDELAPEATPVAEGEAPVLDERVRFNDEHHIMLADARKMKADAQPNDELVFPLETREDYGRIAAQTAKQVIIQRIREAEKGSILNEYEDKVGQIISGKVQKMERGNVFVDLGRVTAMLPREEQVPGEYYRQGERVRAYLMSVDEAPQGVNLRLSRAHPKFIECLFEIEAPEIASGAVEIKAIAREAGSRTKIAVASNDSNIDPVGACVGQRGVRVNTVINELGGEKIDIVEWSTETETLIHNALSPAKTTSIKLFPEENRAQIEVPGDQFSLAVGKGGQNARLAARLTGWKIDIVSPEKEAAEEAAEAQAATVTSDVVESKQDEPVA